MFGEMIKDGIESLLSTRLIGRIGCHADGLTYIVPISYAYDGDYVYAHTFPGLKVDIMRKNPSVCFQVDKMKDMANWESVIAWGKFEEITDPAQRRVALRKLIDRNLPLVSSETVHLFPHWPFIPEDLNTIEGIVFRIELTNKTGRFEKSDVSFASRWQ